MVHVLLSTVSTDKNKTVMLLMLHFCTPCVVDCTATTMTMMWFCLFDDHGRHLNVAFARSEHPTQSNPIQSIQSLSKETGYMNPDRSVGVEGGRRIEAK